MCVCVCVCVCVCDLAIISPPPWKCMAVVKHWEIQIPPPGGARAIPCLVVRYWILVL